MFIKTPTIIITISALLGAANAAWHCYAAQGECETHTHGNCWNIAGKKTSGNLTPWCYYTEG
ncbi:hypothetical protein Vi05172_g1948 [Venturia inaequalis]|nr:hypothetical protein Vi05172_g1948 [Venturia inaequalis]